MPQEALAPISDATMTNIVQGFPCRRRRKPSRVSLKLDIYWFLAWLNFLPPINKLIPLRQSDPRVAHIMLCQDLDIS